MRPIAWIAPALLLAGVVVAQAPVQTHAFVSGTHGYHTYRIPAVVRTNAGTLLAFCEGRVNSSSDRGDIDLVLRRSFDAGRTWSALQVVQQEGTQTIGNPAPVVDRSTGVVWLFFCRNNDRVFVTGSGDDGVTWSPRRELTSTLKLPSWTWYATGPCHGIQLERGAHAGRLVVPCDHNASAYGRGSHVVYSDDRGVTWQLGGSVGQAGGFGPNECVATELTDARVYLNCRNQLGTPKARLFTYSSDGGASFGPLAADLTLVDPVVQASALRVEASDRGDARDWIVFSNPATTSSRTDMTVRSSFDETATWSDGREIWGGPSAYSDLVLTTDDRVGLLYENGNSGPYERITFARIDKQWLDPEPPVGLVAYEGFDYQITDLDGGNGGQGWLGAWTAGLGRVRLGHWRFDGDYFDSSGHARHGIPIGAALSSSVPAQLGTGSSVALGGNDWVDLSAHVGAFQGLRAGTISAWFKTTASSARTILAASDSGDASREIRLLVEAGELWYDVRGDVESTGILNSPGGVNNGAWHHAAATVDSNGSAALYLDGVEVERQQEPFFAAVNGLDRMAVGRNVDSGGGQWYFDGGIDDVVVFGQDLSAAEIAALANGTDPSVFDSGDPPGSTLALPSLGSATLPHAGFTSVGLNPIGRRWSEGGGADAARELSSVLPFDRDGAYYVSCLVRHAGPVDDFAIELRNAGRDPVAQLGWRFGRFAAGGSSMTLGPVTITPGDVWFLVAKIELSTGTGIDQVFLKAYAAGDTVHLVDSELSGLGIGADQWSVISSSFASTAIVDSVRLDARGTSAVFEVDELRIGTTWQSVIGVESSVASVGVGCAGTAGVPAIAATGVPYPGNLSFALEAGPYAISTNAALLVGFATIDPALSLFNGCPFWLDPALPVFSAGSALADPTGFSRWPIGIPNEAGVVGLRLAFQAAAIDPGAGGGFTMSSGLDVVF